MDPDEALKIVRDAATSIETASGIEITIELEGDDVTICQSGHFAGRGRFSVAGQIEDCAAVLGARDGSESEAAYQALELALAEAMSVSAMKGRL